MSVIKKRSISFFQILFCLCLSPAVLTAQEATPEECPGVQRYTFSWSLHKDCHFTPRGGTSRGTEVTLAPDPHPGWLSLQEEGISDKERDRRAILAMAGPYRTSFEFLETVGYTPDFERARPYQSWSTEYVYVVEGSEDFISLQHIIVMFVQGDEGEIQGPFVQKHWRQDWQYEKPAILEYVGNDTWRWRELDQEEIKGTWAQSVYQVDDSPRYESFGRWQHYANFSTWQSGATWRPLPRRESSVRDDYQVLEGRNRHTIVPDGWVHEEENYKVKLDADDNYAADQPYLAKELGVNRYERIVDFDFSAGDSYWQETGEYWRVVREVWEEYLEASGEPSFLSTVEGVPMFAPLFGGAEDYRSKERGEDTGPGALKTAIEEALAPYLQ